MNDLIEQANPLEKMQLASAGANHAVVAIESKRAVAEALGKIQIAKTFPRSLQAAISEFKESCKIIEFAQTAFYAVPNRGSGPSIRFAEEAARCYGNFLYGHKELSRSNGRSVVEVFAWDMEKNNESTRQITIEHIVDIKGGGTKVLKDQADIDNRIANVASKQMRGRILAILPKGLIQIGIAEAKKTLAGDNSEPMSARIQKMTDAFGQFSVTNKHLEAFIGHSLDNVTNDEFVDLLGAYTAIKEGAKASEYFDLTEAKADAAGVNLNAAITAASAPAAATPPAPKPAAARTPSPRTTAQAQAQGKSTTATATKAPASQSPAEEENQQSDGANAGDNAEQGGPLF